MTTWRDARPPRSEQDPRPVAASLERLTRRLGTPSSSTMAAVFARWEDLVGPAVAAHAKPVSLRHGTLRVHVDQPAWATQLRLLSADLLRRLGEGTGDPGAVREVVVAVRPGGPARRGGRPSGDTPLW